MSQTRYEPATGFPSLRWLRFDATRAQIAQAGITRGSADDTLRLLDDQRKPSVDFDLAQEAP